MLAGAVGRGSGRFLGKAGVIGLVFIPFFR